MQLELKQIYYKQELRYILWSHTIEIKKKKTSIIYLN